MSHILESGVTIAVRMHNGVATISTVAFTATGTYTINAADGSLAVALSSRIDIL